MKVRIPIEYINFPKGNKIFLQDFEKSYKKYKSYWRKVFLAGI